MGNENNSPQTYRWRINTPAGCGLLVPTACTREGNSPPRRRNEPCSSTRSSGKVSLLQLRLAGFPCVAFSLCGLTVLEHAPRCCSTLMAFPNKPLKSQEIPVQKQEACEPGRCFRDAIEGHHPQWAWPFFWLLGFPPSPMQGEKPIPSKRCATTRPKAASPPGTLASRTGGVAKPCRWKSVPKDRRADLCASSITLLWRSALRGQILGVLSKGKSK